MQTMSDADDVGFWICGQAVVTCQNRLSVGACLEEQGHERVIVDVQATSLQHDRHLQKEVPNQAQCCHLQSNQQCNYLLVVTHPLSKGIEHMQCCLTKMPANFAVTKARQGSFAALAEVKQNKGIIKNFVCRLWASPML